MIEVRKTEVIEDPGLWDRKAKRLEKRMKVREGNRNMLMLALGVLVSVIGSLVFSAFGNNDRA